MRKRGFITLIGAMVLLLGLSIPQCAPSGGEATPPNETVPIGVDLEMSKAPKLNEIVELTCTVSSVFDWDMPNCVANVELPNGAVKVDGDLSWSGAIEKDIPVQFSATIKFVEEGVWVIEATATEFLDDDNSWGDITAICLNVTEDQGRFIEEFEAGPGKAEQSSPGDGKLVPEFIEEEELEFSVEIPEDPPAVELNTEADNLSDNATITITWTTVGLPEQIYAEDE